MCPHNCYKGLTCDVVLPKVRPWVASLKLGVPHEDPLITYQGLHRWVLCKLPGWAIGVEGFCATGVTGLGHIAWRGSLVQEGWLAAQKDSVGGPIGGKV